MPRPILAIVSPNGNVYSETFIQAHRRLIDADVRYYYKYEMPRVLDGVGVIEQTALFSVVKNRLRRRLFHPKLKMDELAFRDSLVRERVQVVLAEYGTTGAALLRVCQDLRLPLIVHFHGFDASVDSVLSTHRNTYKELFQYAHSVIVVSRVMERRIRDLGCPQSKIIYNVYGPDDAFLDLKSVTPKTARFVGIGRFVDKKAPHLTLLAFKQVLKYFEHAELVIAGEGPLWQMCKDLAKYYEIQSNVKFPGVLTPAEIHRLFGCCTAYVQHSVTDKEGNMEGTPVAVLEAAAAATPVISTKHAGIPDVVIHGETGLLVEEYDVAGMADAMRQMLENPEKARAMGKAGRKRVQQHFTMDRHIGILNRCIHEVL